MDMPAEQDPEIEAEEILKQIFASNLRAYRRERGISQLALANELGLSPAYYGSIERGQRNLQFSTVGRIADSIGVHPFDLLTGHEPPPEDDDE
ncbi:helix-turn-helix domain-containing protein [Leucobacter massiliensis]|nr:helix-turn-helix transcriptional regulator [Leucobacter massiliensis]